MERRHVLIYGFVQGVGFRFSVERTARSHAVFGWVRNRADGAVEAVFEGEREDVEALVDFCRQGPRGAEVEHVDVVDESPQGLDDFHVAG